MHTRFATVAVLAWCLVRPARAQQQVAVVTPDASPPRAVELPAEATVRLEAPGIPGTTVPVVSVMINGHGPFRAAIETGAGFVGATRSFADSLGLRLAGSTEGLNTYLVDSIRVGNARFDGVELLALNTRGATGADVILGLSFFHDVLLVIDYPAGVVVISRDSLPAANGRDVLALSHAGPFWAVPVTIGGRDLSAVLDTRSAGPNMSLAPNVAATLTFTDSLRVVGRSGGAAIPSTEVKEGRLVGDVRLGAYTFPHPLLSVRELPPGFPVNPLLGDVMLRHFQVALDQRHGRLRLRHEGDPVIILPEPQRAAPGHQ